jgi:CRP/FNR family transcriptional regulator, cyclic AMP receptor protein
MRSPYGLELAESCQDCPLKSEGFFCKLSVKALKTWEAIKFTTAYPEGAILFVEGQPSRGLFMLCKGRVKMSMNSSEGKALIVKIVGPGEVLGLNSAVSGRPYELTVETLEPCQINFVKREDFLRFLGEHTEASIQAAQQLSGSYHTACDQIRALGLSQSAPEKLARFLLNWSGKGQQTGQGIRVKLALTHEEIAQTIGSSRETVTRTLGNFKNRQFATLKGSTLMIQNKAALERFVTA